MRSRGPDPHALYLEAAKLLVDREDETTAMKKLQLAAHGHHVAAQFAFGLLTPFRAAPGTEEEFRDARAQLKAAAKSGHAQAANAMSLFARSSAGDHEELETMIADFLVDARREVAANTDVGGVYPVSVRADGPTLSKVCLLLVLLICALAAFAFVVRLEVGGSFFASQRGIGATVVALLLAAWATHDNSAPTPARCRPIPRASPNLPILGNAPFYKRDPAAFLLRQYRALGQIFALNLAGFHTVIVCDDLAMRQFAMAPESQLSATAAVADFGFLDTLGALNVSFGAAAHKMMLKTHVPSLANGVVAHAVEVAVAARIQGENAAVNLLPCMRRIFLDITLELLVGRDVLAEKGAEFVEEFMVFQDALEEATAQAIVLPAWLAGPLVTRKVGRMRRGLEKTLETGVNQAWAAGGGGIWTKNLRAIRKPTANQLGQQEGQDEDGGDDHRNLSAHDVAQLIIGLLFAAHKNPGIGASQTLIFLLQDPNLHESVCKDAGSAPSLASFLQNPRDALDNVILEALRCCAHPIGAIRKVVDPAGFVLKSSTGAPHYLPPNSYVAASHILPHLTNFSNGENFDPTRFVDRPLPDEYSLTTFSNGVHKCPGERLAMTLIRAVLGAMLRTRQISLGAGEIPKLDFRRATLAQRAGPVMIKFE